MGYVIHEETIDGKTEYIHDCGGKIVKTPNDACPGEFMAMCEKCKQIIGPWARNADIPIRYLVTTPDYENLVKHTTTEYYK